METHISRSSSTHRHMSQAVRRSGPFGNEDLRRRRAANAFVCCLRACILLLGACEALQRQDSTAEQPCVVSGRVIGANGQGISDALVQVVWDRGPHGSTFMCSGEYRLYPKRQDLHSVASATTNDAGEFSFSLPTWFASMDYEAFLLASKPGCGAAFRHLEGSNNNAQRTIRLAGESMITGNVVDESGRPEVGARVGLVEHGLEVASTLTDERGNFSIGRTVQGKAPTEASTPAPPAVGVSGEVPASIPAHGEDSTEACRMSWGEKGPPWALFVSRSQHDLGKWVGRPTSSVAVSLVLPRGFSRTVHVRDAAGQPLRDEVVCIMASSSVRNSGEVRWTEMRTDNDGVIVIEGLDEDRVSVGCAGDVERVGPGPAPVVVLEGVRQLPLQVVDADTGIGLSDVVIFHKDFIRGCVLLGKDRWQSGDLVTFEVGKKRLFFMANGYESRSKIFSADSTSGGVTVRMKKRATN